MYSHAAAAIGGIIHMTFISGTAAKEVQGQVQVHDKDLGAERRWW
jgi:hypothetical protein